MADRHGPNRLNKYIEIHQTVMDRFRSEGVVDFDSLEFLPGAQGHMSLDGEISLFDGRLKITVSKSLEVTYQGGADLVQTREYSYNVSIVGKSNVFRYCSPHKDSPGPEHHEYHHRHQYEPFGVDVDANTVATRHDGDWPLLGEVIREAADWYWHHVDQVKALLGE